MDEENLQFAKEIIKEYGEDRFYHACDRTGSRVQTKRIFKEINGNDKDWDEKENILGLSLVRTENNPILAKWTMDHNLPEIEKEEARENMCRIFYTLIRHYKEFGIRSKNTPANLHLRMILDQNNEWTKKYVELLEDK